MKTTAISWYTTGFANLRTSHSVNLKRLEAQFAVRETLKHLTEPIFQDYSKGGRMVGFFFRLGRVTISLLMYVFISIGYLIAAVIWLFLPLLIAISLIGYFAGSTTTPPQTVSENTSEL